MHADVKHGQWRFEQGMMERVMNMVATTSKRSEGMEVHIGHETDTQMQTSTFYLLEDSRHWSAGSLAMHT
jgi:hypothetical protein